MNFAQLRKKAVRQYSQPLSDEVVM